MTDVFSVSSLEEYIKIVERFSPNFSLSRGQGSDLPLFPSALRRDQDGMRLYSKTTIQSFLEDFKFNSQMYIEGASTYHENDWLIHAQHFGVPTCLFYKNETTKKEIDVIIQKDGKVVPIEVKSGNTRANSLKSIMKNNKDISYGYKFIDENIGTSEEGIITLPLYMIAFFDKVSE